MGDGTVIKAAMNADLLLRKGDLEGHRTWLAIMRKIKDLEQAEPPGSVH